MFNTGLNIKLDSILKSRDITLPTKVHLVKGVVFPVVMHGCGSWTKKSWVPENWCFWTVMLEKTLKSPLDCKEIQPVNPKGNQLNSHWKDWCWSWKSNPLATWWEELTHCKQPFCWERLKAEWEMGNKRWDGGVTLSKLQDLVTTGKAGVLQSMGSHRVRHGLRTEMNW